LENHAIISTGGKQYMVKTGQSFNIESIDGDIGDVIEFSDVLFISEDGKSSIGTPTVKGAKVKAEIVRNGRDKKIIVFKYKNKIRYRKKNGHRQEFTEINIKDILIDKPKTTKRSVANGS
tara:strand:+ start:5561 stop:5920 length:360 start_codon:yes stop_codon:yes gene_type:complete